MGTVCYIIILPVLIGDGCRDELWGGAASNTEFCYVC
jgi:hypothetical protein